jgi:SAM-dependent methyltransferase
MVTNGVDLVEGPSRYTFNNADDQGPRMLGLLAGILDEHTTHVLAGTGVGPGWTCLDVGPGAGTITSWLAERVRPHGQVTALDLNPSQVPASANVAVIQGDVRTFDLPAGRFHLIHARLLLVHLAEREQVLDRLVHALRPGGLLVLSEWDVESWKGWLQQAPSEEAAAAFAAFQNALAQVLESNGADLGWALRVRSAMREAGLVDVNSVGFTELANGGEPGCLLHESNSLQLHDRLIATGEVTADQLETLRQAMWDKGFSAYNYLMFTTVGRRPYAAEAGR